MINVIITTLNQFSIEGIINALATKHITIPCMKYIYELIFLNHLNMFFEPLIRISFTTEKRPKEIKGAYNDISLPDLSIFNNAINTPTKIHEFLNNGFILYLAINMPIERYVIAIRIFLILTIIMAV